MDNISLTTLNMDFINALIKVLTNYIDQQVDKKVGEVLASSATMKEIDESFEKRIREIANAEAVELIDEHCGNEEHKDDDDIESLLGDHDFSDQLYEAVNDYDFSDAAEAALRNYDLADHVKRAISELEFKVSVE